MHLGNLSEKGVTKIALKKPTRYLSYLRNKSCVIIIYEALCFDVAQGRMNVAPNENQTHSSKFVCQDG